MLLALALVAASSAHPAKMIVSTTSGLAITDFASLQQCEAAKVALEAAWLKEQQRQAPAGYRLVKVAPLTVICVAT